MTNQLDSLDEIVGWARNEAQVHEEETNTASSFYLMHGCRREVRITHTLALSQFYTRRDSLSRCLNQYVAYKCSGSLRRSHDKVRHSHSRSVLSRFYLGIDHHYLKKFRFTEAERKRYPRMQITGATRYFIASFSSASSHSDES